MLSNYASLFRPLDQKKTWFLSACLRAEENVALSRAVDDQKNVFEFFVPKDQEEDFLKIMKILLDKDIVKTLEKTKNRFLS